MQSPWFRRWDIQAGTTSIPGNLACLQKSGPRQPRRAGCRLQLPLCSQTARRLNASAVRFAIRGIWGTLKRHDLCPGSQPDRRGGFLDVENHVVVGRGNVSNRPQPPSEKGRRPHSASAMDSQLLSGTAAPTTRGGADCGGASSFCLSGQIPVQAPSSLPGQP